MATLPLSSLVGPGAASALPPRSLRALGFFAERDDDGILGRRRLRPGDTIFAAGTPADRVAFVLSGVARSGATRVATGQCAGGDRTYDLTAESSVVILEVAIDRFHRWLDAQVPSDDAWVGRLVHVQRLPEKKLLTVYDTSGGGEPCTVTIHGDPSTDGIVTTHFRTTRRVLLARCRVGDGVEATIRWGDRTIGLVDVARDDAGAITSATLARATTTDDGAAAFYRRMIDAPALDTRDIARFRDSGRLCRDGADPNVVCQCLRVREVDLGEADSTAAVQRECGAGLVCGGCKPAIDALVELRVRRASFVAAAFENVSPLARRTFGR